MTSVMTQPANGGAHGLVSRGHNGRLRYANPQDLPSYPSIGLKKDGSAANVAALLGWESQKPLEFWRPEQSASASAAAMLAKDYKMAPLWQPQRSDAGSRAAVLAAESAGRHVQHSRNPSSPPSLWGNSAANQAVRAGQQPTQKPESTPATTNLARQGSLSAARGAMAGSRPRAKTSPSSTRPSYPDEANAARNALNAAATAHRPSLRVPAIPIEEAGAVPYTTMDRQMFTSRPPVQPEVDEKRRNDVIHASAVAMAKRMYNQQQQQQQQRMRAATTAGTAAAGHRRTMSGSDVSEIEPPGGSSGFGNLQEAAYRLAQERLAKLHEEHQKSRDFREYYSGPTASAQQQRFSIRGKLRRRASSDGAVTADRKRSQQIRQQMSLFSAKLSEVDEQKRQRDREAVLAAAQRNVKAKLQGMDDKLYAETGQVPPSRRDEWEAKAQAAAAARSEARRDVNAGKVDIGGGRFMDRAEVDQIAARRVQPVLEEINERAEKERERQAALKLEEEKRREDAEKKKARDKEVQDIHRKLKEQQKLDDRVKALEVKQQERAKKDEEKAARAEQKRQAKEEKAKGKEVERESLEEDERERHHGLLISDAQEPAEPAQATKKKLLPQKLLIRHREPPADAAAAAAPAAAVDATSPSAPKSPGPEENATSPGSRVKSWWRKLSRPRAKSAPTGVLRKDGPETQKKSFIGGAALANSDEGSGGGSGDFAERNASMREVALAGGAYRGGGLPSQGDEPGESSAMAAARRVPEEAVRPGLGGTGHDEVSPVSSYSTSSDEKFVDTREELDLFPGGLRAPGKLAVAGPPSISGGSTQSPAKESRFVEKFE